LNKRLEEMTQYLRDSKPAPQIQGMVDGHEEYILAHPEDDESNTLFRRI
jgi:hypothetical protein